MLLPDQLTIYAPELAIGLLTTLGLTMGSLLLAAGLALLCSYGLFIRHPVVTWVIRGYIFFIRGTPLLIQMYLFYYGLSGTWLSQPAACALLALGANSAAYTTVLLAEAIRALPTGPQEAAWALGLSRTRIWWGILCPWAIRRVIPAYGNEMIIILKSTALASTITLMDLMGVIQQLSALTYETIQWLHVAGIAYGIIALIMILGIRYLEKIFRF